MLIVFCYYCYYHYYTLIHLCVSLMSTSVSVRSFFQMQVIAAHNRLPKRALFFHIATNPERQSWLLWLFTAPFFISVILRGWHFSSWLQNHRFTFRHCICHQESKKETKCWRQNLPPLRPPLLLVRGHLSEVYSQHLTVLGHSSLKKAWERHYFGCTCGCHKQKQGSFVKRRRTDMGRRGRTRCLAQQPLRTRSTGFAY